MSALFSFPNPVNEYAARTVATWVFLLSTTTVLLSLTVDTGWLALTAVLAVGFALRAAAGPRFSPVGRIASRVIGPRIGDKPVAGPPKRFAQTLGLVMSSVALVLFLLGLGTASTVVVGLLVVASFLEAALGFCLGCVIFAGLIRAGVIPQQVCVACATWTPRVQEPTPAA